MVKKRLLFLLIFASLIVCRPGSKRDECKSRLNDKVSFCDAEYPFLLFDFSDGNLEDEKKRTNLILIDCMLDYVAKEKCNGEKWYQPTIY